VKPALLEFLACPRCAGVLISKSERSEGGEVLEGTLGCVACRASFPIRGGIPRILPDALSTRERATSRAFGAQWKMLAALSGVFRAEFQSYLDPLPASELQGLVVLDAGCGMGKFSFAAAEAGARAVVAVDLSDAVEVAYANLRAFPNAHVVQGSIGQLPFRVGAFDFAFSIGVLHHTPDPEKSFQHLVPFVRPGGRLFVWLYALEGNECFVRWLDPLRAAVFSRLPSWLNRAAATLVALPLWAVIRLVYVPLGEEGIVRRLPYAEYFLYFSRLGLRPFWGTVYDKLVPPISFYLTRDELHRWVTDAGLTELFLRHRNGNSWSSLARREQGV
jgi:SAM-dependent methyltransferase